MFTALFGGDARVASLPTPTRTGDTDWDAVFATLDATLPAGRAVFLSPGDALSFRNKMPEELHPNGRSVIRIAHDGALLSAIDASASARGQRMMNALYPLHAGRAGSEPWRAAVAVTGLLPLFFFVTGLYTWLARRRDAKLNQL